MKKFVNCITVLILSVSISAACNKSSKDADGRGGVEKHFVKGRVLDEAGRPVKDVQVIIDNTIIYSTAITAVTDENGYYKAALGAGTWRVDYGEITRTLEGETFKMQVHSEDRSIFNYNTGAVVNLTWKLSGRKEPNEPFFYGGDVQFYYAGSGGINFDYITFKFEPVVLIDGSKPAPFTRKVTNGYYIPDIPIGKYKITGTYQEPGQTSSSMADFRDVGVNPNGDFSPGGITALFYPGPGLPLNCTNCLKLDFK